MARKHDGKGRSKGDGRHIRLTFHLLETPAWRTLPVYERAAFLEVAQLYDGSNNGFLAMGVRRLAERLNVSPNKAAWALKELVARGFLEVTEGSAFSRKDRMATCYRLTTQPCNRTHQAPSKAFQSWRPAAPEKKTTVAPRERTVARGATVIPLQSHRMRP